MIGIKFVKFDSMTYVIKYTNGSITREGRGLSFYYYAPTTSIAAVPLGSNNLPFIFNESTQDYQNVGVQGQIVYKVSNPKQLAELLDFTVDHHGVYKKDDTEKLNERIISEAQTSASSYIHELGIKEAIRSAKMVEERISEGVMASNAIAMLGIEILGVNILAIKATPEMERALETDTREKLNQEADQAIYERRNFAVEQERRIKESELNTEIAVEEKKRQIAQKQMESKVQQSENDRQLREMKLQTDIAIEDQRQQLVEQRSANQRKEAETRGFVLDTTLKPYREMDWKVLLALTGNNDARNNVALAFRELAENADKIGNLNISPELLANLLGSTEEK